MFAILCHGDVIALCDQPRYIRQNPETGVYVEAEEADATGVAVGGKAYNLPGCNIVPDAETVEVVHQDGGEYVFETRHAATENTLVGGIVFVTLAEAGQIDDETAAEHTDLFEYWAYPIHYVAGNLRIDPTDNALYRCVQEHTSQEGWNPSAAVSLWARAANPAEEWPEWSQPVGAHDAYNQGDKTSHNAKHWVSDVNANIWEPGVYGWTESTD